MTDKFDKKAENLLKNDRQEQLTDVLREYALYVGVDTGKEIDNPEKYLEELNLKQGVRTITEFRVAKGMLKEKVRQDA